ncbi:DUF1549 domain-containing protein [Stieleria maiorica]|uniref:DUF1549 domain-containing protein n=1 Tax=Stieleria maiorica TaxID=2795974 RepID=UPI00142F2BF3|nr:DUF1549 domain-containing protein [Stieleria maiorica]
MLASLVAGTTNGQFDALIDREVARQHGERETALISRCSDEVFLRRVYLDLSGRNPTAAQAREFLDSEAPNKRDALIDELIERPSFGVNLADRWDTELTYGDSQWPLIPFTRWLQRQFNEDRPWDETARELLTATGAQFSNPAVTMFFGAGKNQTLSPEQATDLVGRAFMGITLECAQCHDHPNSEWTHRQYWGIAGFLGNTTLTSKWPNRALAPSREVHEVEGVVVGVADAAAPDWRYESPDRALNVVASLPDQETGTEGRAAAYRRVRYRAEFADWLLQCETPYLARSFVNRVWHHLFGCGLVDPVDDHRTNNPPRYTELHNELVKKFREDGYKIKKLYREICQSATYQQEGVSHDDPRDLAGTNLRVLSPNQLFDCFHSILGEEAVTYTRGIYGARGARRGFIRGFGDEASIGKPTSFSKGMRDFLKVLNSQKIEGGTRWRIEQHRDLWDTPPAIVEELFLLTLSRRPSPNELSTMLQFIQESESADQGYEGVLWTLLNSGEFFVIP